MDGIVLTPLKRIRNPRGDIFHAMKKSDIGYSGFGEAYFSTVLKDEIKGWKKHTRMTLNLIVPIGEVEFVLFDDREGSASINEFYTVNLSLSNYQRLTVPSGVWLSFRGVGTSVNMLLNVASIEHDPLESISVELKEIEYEW